MGDPKKTRKKYRGPLHPWQATRLAEEAIIKRNYGLKNKKEIWKVATELQRLKSQAKKLIRERSKPGFKITETKKFLKSLEKYGWATEDSPLEAVLTLELKELLDRRLQTITYKKGLTLTVGQARQFIVHGHVTVNARKLTAPGYMVTIEEQPTVTFNINSTVSSEEHPERTKRTRQKEKAAAKKIKEETQAKEEITEKELGITEKELEVIEKEIIVEAAE